MSKFKHDEERILEDLRECSTYCPNCKHTNVMMAKSKFCICSHCGKKVINQSKARFKYEFIKKTRKLEEKKED